MNRRWSKLHEDTNLRTMRLLVVNLGPSQRQMGKLLGLSFGYTFYCLNTLFDNGCVKIENFSQNQNEFG